jgi:hypothetical protein
MSYRRPLSFTRNEKDLLEAFDNNGKARFAKMAMRFYLDNKDKVVSDKIINDLKSILEQSTGIKKEVNPIVNQKAFSLMK